MLNRQKIDISSPKLISTITATKNQTHSRWDILIPEKKPLMVNYDKQADEVEIRSVTPENVQECLESIGLDFSKYNKFRAWQKRHHWLNTLQTIEEIKRNIIEEKTTRQHSWSVLESLAAFCWGCMYQTSSTKNKYLNLEKWEKYRKIIHFIASYKWVSCSKFYVDCNDHFVKLENIKSWNMTKRYSFLTVQVFKEVINIFKGGMKKPKGYVRIWSTVAVNDRRTKQNKFRNGHKMHDFK